MNKSKNIVKRTKKPVVKKKNEVLVNFVLDRSGSMEQVRKQTIDGVNEYLSGLRKDTKTNYTFTLALFSADILNAGHTDQPYLNAKLADVKDITEDTYQPNGGTPLYDAIGHTIKRAEEAKVDKFLTVIMTDGYENASHDFSLEKLKALIEEKEKLGNWTFVFLSATLNAVAQAQTMGMHAGNAAHYSARYTGQTVAAAASATRSYSASNFNSSRVRSAMNTNFMKSANYVIPQDEEEENEAKTTTTP